jgi:glycosyltransferase involved in cell wall biosynthesis
MAKYKLSVVVPIAKMSGRLDNLRFWLQSALALNIQVVLVHDKQDEITGLELSELVSKSPYENLVFLEKTLNSPGLARNYGRTATQGEWIAFWDSDDLPIPHKYLEMICEAEKNQKPVAIGGFQSQNLITHIIDVVHAPNKNLNSIFRHPGIWRMAFKSKLIRDLSFSEFRMAEDQLYLAELNLESGDAYFSEKLVYTYIIGSETQLTKNKSALRSIPLVTKEMAKKIENNFIKTSLGRLLFLKLCVTQLKHSKAIDKIRAVVYIAKLIKNPLQNGIVFYSFLRYWRQSHL